MMEKGIDLERIVVEITYPSRVSEKERQRITASIEKILTAAACAESVETES